MQDPLNLASDANAVSKAKMGGEIITQTLDNLNGLSLSGKKKNAKTQSDMSQSYEFNKSVLSAVYDAKGIGIDNKA